MEPILGPSISFWVGMLSIGQPAVLKPLSKEGTRLDLSNVFSLLSGSFHELQKASQRALADCLTGRLAQ